MKKGIAVLLLLIVACFHCGCSYTAYKHTYTDIEQYANIWTLSGFRHGYDGISPLFPENPSNLEVLEFICRYDEQLPLGEGVQLLLRIRYEEQETFCNEVDRIAAITYGCDSAFGGNSLSAYAVRLGEKQSSEYALVDFAEQTIFYIYLQNVPLEEIEFDHELVPSEYIGYGELKTEDSSLP